jgi:hypothetical protein
MSPRNSRAARFVARLRRDWDNNPNCERDGNRKRGAVWRSQWPQPIGEERQKLDGNLARTAALLWLIPPGHAVEDPK